MHPLTERLLGEILRIPIVDPCLRLDPRRPTAAGLDDLAGCLDGAPRQVSRAGAGTVVPEDAPIGDQDRLQEVLRSLLDLDPSGDPESLRAEAGRRMAAPGWEREVLERTGLDRGIVALPFDDSLEGFDRRRYVPGLDGADPVFGLADPAVRTRLAATTGIEVIHLKSLGRALEAVVGRFRDAGGRSWTVTPSPDFAPLREEEGTAGAALSKALAGKANANDRARLSRRAFWDLAGAAAACRMPLVLRLEGPAPLAGYDGLLRAFPGLPVVLSGSSPEREGERIAWVRGSLDAVLLGHPGIAGLPAFLDGALRARLQGVPRRQLLAYSGEVYRLEFALPKFNMYRHVLASVLAEELVERRRWSEEAALDIARALLKENPERTFALGAEAAGGSPPVGPS